MFNPCLLLLRCLFVVLLLDFADSAAPLMSKFLSSLPSKNDRNCNQHNWTDVDPMELYGESPMLSRVTPYGSLGVNNAGLYHNGFFRDLSASRRFASELDAKQRSAVGKKSAENRDSTRNWPKAFKRVGATRRSVGGSTSGTNTGDARPVFGGSRKRLEKETTRQQNSFPASRA